MSVNIYMQKNEVRPFTYIMHMGHNLPKTHLHLKLKLLKIIEEDIGVSPPDLELGKTFLDILQKADIDEIELYQD